MMRFLSLLIILTSLFCYAFSSTTVKPELKKKIQKTIKDLYNADINDLQKLGIHFAPRPASFRGRSSGGRVRMGEISSLEEETKDAVPGKCDPKPVCISNPLILNISSTQLAFPQCINIHRCEGCCPTNEKCVAVGSHEVKLQKVGIINFEDGNEPQFSETFISVLNHTDCQCQCQWQTDQDCKAVNPNYVKNENACECVCPTEMYCGPLREFDSETCSCKCRKANFARLEQSCKIRGFTWSDQNCKCEVTRTSVNQKEIRINN